MTALSVYGLSLGLPAFALLKVVLPAFTHAKTPRRQCVHGIAALLTNMLLNFAFLALLYQLMVPDALKAQGILAALGQQPGLHLALGIASALSSYLNLGLLWYGSAAATSSLPRVEAIHATSDTGMCRNGCSPTGTDALANRFPHYGPLAKDGLVGDSGECRRTYLVTQVLLGWRRHHLRPSA